MIFGMPSLACFRSIEENLAFASQLGLDFVELNMNLPFCTVQALQEENLRALCEKYGVFLTLHADENLFFCDFNHLVADAHLQTMLDTISLCRENDIPLINFHMSEGVHFSLPGRKDRLIHMHLHDALGKKNHLALGTGEIDLKAFLNAASPQRVVIEVKAPDELTESVSYLKSHLR